jgi:hypothetical protein
LHSDVADLSQGRRLEAYINLPAHERARFDERHVISALSVGGVDRHDQPT